MLKKPQPFNDAMVQINQLSLRERVDVDAHGFPYAAFFAAIALPARANALRPSWALIHWPAVTT